MSTLGGSRGERNAKPKFSALDINRMYKNSRGETSEPSAQKNQVPRKHGMQILGKVPSARRPPANLPSLKAEISSPTANNNSTITSPREEACKNSATISTSTSGNQISATTALIKNSNNPSNFGNKNNNSASVVGIGSKLINNSSSFGGGNSGTVQQQRNISSLSNHGNNQYHQQPPITWSAVTTGSDNSNNKVGVGSKSAIPPLYQSPQFQYEFPTLDGTVGGVGSGGANSIKKDQSNQHSQQTHHQSQQNQLNSQQQPNQPNQRDSQHGRHSYDHSSNFAHDCRDANESDDDCGGDGTQRELHEVSLRPQTDAAAWLQQQEKSAKSSQESASNLLGPVPQSGNMTTVPLPILSLMPSFMQRASPGASSGITVGNPSGISSTPINNQNGISGKEYSSQMGSNSSRLHRSGGKHNSNSQEPGNFRSGNSINKRSAPPSHGSLTPNSGIGIRKEKEFMVEPELAQMQRPIIREEDLERLNAIANDDSWTKQDDIDYTKKLTFSDDESPEENSSLQERERLYDKLASESVSGASDIRKNSIGNNSCSGSNWQRSGNDSRNSSERERSADFEHESDQRQQNGPRSSAAGPNISIESSVYERMKQRKEEEERREMERKQGAAKKLQELEKKLSNKKNAGSNVIGDCLEQPNATTSLESNCSEDLQQSQMRRPVGSGNRTDYDRVQREIRSIGDFNRGERGSNSNASGSTSSSAKPIFSAQFQSNLPPRFQRQQQMQAQQSGQQASHPNSNSSGSRSITASGSGGVEKSASMGSAFDSGRHGQKGALPQRGSGGRNDFREGFMRNSGGYGRNRNDMERDDERYNRGRNDDYMRGNNQSKLSRSVSDTSQRKTSVSSNDESTKFGSGEPKDFGGAALVSSWAEETDTELKRHRDESFSSSHSHESIPIKILQRPNTQKSVSEDASSNWNQHLSEQSENDDTHFAPTQILRRSESSEEKPQNSSLKSGSNEIRKTGDEKPQNQGESSASAEAPTQKEGSATAVSQSNGNAKKDAPAKLPTAADEKTVESNKSESQAQRDPKRSSSRTSSGRDRDKDRERDRERGSNIRSYGYRGARDSNTWSNRGTSMRSGGGRYYNSNEQPFQSESEHSEGVEEDSAYGNSNQRKEHAAKAPRKEHGRRGGGNSSYNIDERGFKEGFAPRGEPSRRGRGGGGTIGDRGSSMSYRRNNDSRHMGGSGNQSRQYGRQGYDETKAERSGDSKQSSSAVEVDKTKQNQIALSAGLSNKAKDAPLTSTNSSFKQQTLQSSVSNSQLKKSNDVDNTASVSLPSAGGNSSRKDHALPPKTDENVSDREKKSSSKEKDNVCIQAMGQRSSSNVAGSASKKVDLPMTSLSTGAPTITSKSSQQQTIAKPPPGLGGLKSGSSTPTVSNAAGSNSQAQMKQSTAELHKSSQSQLRSIAPESDKAKQNISIGDKAGSNGNLLLDGAPVNTIIFENTNYKQQAQAAATSTTRSAESVAATVSNVTGVNVSVVDTLSNALSQMSFAKVSESTATCAPSSDYEKDMKLGFNFGDTDSYSNPTNVPAEPDVAVQQPSNVGKQQQQAQNIISTAELNMKIASVKKVWENVSPMTSVDNNSVLQQQQQQQQTMQHQVQQQLEGVDTAAHISAASFVAAVAASQQQHQHQQHIPHYAVAPIHMHQHHSLPSPVQNTYSSHNSAFDSTQLDQQFGQSTNIVVGGEEGTVMYPQQQQQSAPQQQAQVLKHPDVVKQQQAATPKQLQQQHGSSIGMSPPPTLQQQQQHQQHQQSAAQIHTAAHQPFYQASAQFTGIPTIPSPPVFNSSQIPPPSQAGLYAPFHSLDHSSRSQFSAAAAHSFPGHYNAPAAGGPFNAYTMQTPPNLATAPTPDMYPSLTSQFRMGAGGPSPFGNPNSQQMNNANAAAVAIISSNSNSLMSSVGSVKPPPSSQQLGTIGSKGAGAGGPYAAAAQQYMSLYAGPPQHPQTGPTAHQLQSSNYYSNSGGPSGPPYYGAPPPPQNNPGGQNYGLAAAASLYGSHQGGPPGSNSGQGPQSQHTLSNFNAPFMNSPLLTAAGINQYRGGPNQGAATYLKSNQNQNHLQDSMGRQLKSPLGADVSLNIAKQVQSQSSPPHHKNYGTWDIQNQVMQQQSQQQQQVSQQRGGSSGNTQNMNASNRSGNSVSGNAQQCQQPGNVNISMGVNNSGQGRYPTPIQRPTNYPPHSQVGSQQQQQQQSSQQGQRPTNLRQANNTGIQSNGSNGPHNSISNTGGNGGSNNSVNSSHSGTGNGGQASQMNKSPYYSNNANSGASRANHT